MQDKGRSGPCSGRVHPLDGHVDEDAFGRLPDEMVRAVLAWLDGRALGRISATCVRLHALASDTTLWEAACRRCLCAPSVLFMHERTITQPETCAWLDAAVLCAPSPPSSAATAPYKRPHTFNCLPPVPEAPPPTLLLSEAPRSWRWLAIAMHTPVAAATKQRTSSSGVIAPWLTRWVSSCRIRPQVAHSVRVEQVAGDIKVIVQMGDLDQRGDLCGFGMRAVATKSAVGRSDAHGTRSGGDGDTENDALVRSDWQWSEWAWGTWRDGRVEGTARVCSTAGTVHMGKFVGGLAHGRGMRVVEAGCDHDGVQPTLSVRSKGAAHQQRPCVHGDADILSPLPHTITVSGCWRAGQPHGRMVQTTTCGDIMTATWKRGVLVTIESLLLPARPSLRGGRAFGGVRISGMPWRVDTVAAFAPVGAPFDRCLVAMPADPAALDTYLDYVRAGHPCMRPGVAEAVLAAGAHFRAALAASLIQPTP